MTGLFGDIEQLAASCRFSDCRHGNEPGCAVREALHNGSLAQERWASWQKLQRELAYLETKKDDAARMQKLLDILEDLDDVQDVFHNAAL